jgi:hypothetical protein
VPTRRGIPPRMMRPALQMFCNRAFGRSKRGRMANVVRSTAVGGCRAALPSALQVVTLAEALETRADHARADCEHEPHSNRCLFHLTALA